MSFREESATTDSALKAPAQVEQKDFDALLKRLDELEKLEKEDEDEESSANE